MAKKKSKITQGESLDSNQLKNKQPEESLKVVAIGASAGGLQALYGVFDHLSFDKNDNFCIVVIQHLSPDYKSLMPELLARHTQMKISPIESGMEIESGVVYVSQPNKVFSIVNGVFVSEDRDHSNLVHYPINSFFSSLAEAYGTRAIAVILSGSGSDGTQGIEAIKDKGGIVVVQEESTAAFNGMPKNAIMTGLVDRIAPPEEIPAIIKEYLVLAPEGNQVSSKKRAQGASDEALAMMLLNIINEYADFDFANYKSNTILRRIERRIQKLQYHDFATYYEYVSNNPKEAKVLADEFLINVTGFFRDEKAFNYIETKIFPDIVSEHNGQDQIRIWSVGCSTGQEAYSLAMLLSEYLIRNKLRKRIKIFATDAHAASLNYASKGNYTKQEVENVPDYLLDKYFTELDDATYQVKANIRDMIVFAIHNVVKDPPFNNLHLVSCRNLLIYIKPELQQKILSFFHFALVDSGKLFLGSSESPFLGDKKFEVVSTTHRVYKKKKTYTNTDVVGLYAPGLQEKVSGPKSKGSTPMARRSTDFVKVIDKIKDAVLEDMTPPCVVITHDFEILHVFGAIERFLHFPKKQFQMNLLRMIAEDMYIPINTLVSTIKKENRKVVFSNVKTLVGDNKVILRLIGTPISDPNGKTEFIAVCFDE
ncbi:MAG: CheR family methyltransferase, partial [Luteibaculum sp.]